MARPLRIQYPGAVYHVTSRGNERKAVFRDAHDRTTFLKVLQQVVQRYHWLCHAYCMMDNHYHLLVETPDGNLSLGMRQLNGAYAQAFNRRHRRVGHLLQGRFQAILIQKNRHLLEVCRYVVLNPVRAGVVEQPEQWPWSSYLATAGKRSPRPCLTTDWVLGQFSTKRGRAENAYRQFVREGVGKASIWGEVKAQSLLGGEEFVEGLIDYLRGHQAIPEIPKSQRYLHRPGLHDLFNPAILGDRRRRDRTIAKAVEEHGYSQREVANHLGMHCTSISRILRNVMPTK